MTAMDVCFLVGAPRSGTTWFQRLLQSHPRICGGEESHFFSLFGGVLKTADKMQSHVKPIGPLIYADRRKLVSIIRDDWEAVFSDLYAANPEAAVHLEKTPSHALHLNQISDVFPESRVIFLIRDSRAVASSLRHAGRGWGDYWAPKTAKGAATMWWSYVDAIDRWRRDHPDHAFLTIRYEDALQDPRAALGQALSFLFGRCPDAEIEATLENFEAARSAHKDPPGFARVRGAGGWKEDLSPFAKLVVYHYTRRKMREHGYSIGLFD